MNRTTPNTQSATRSAAWRISLRTESLLCLISLGFSVTSNAVFWRALLADRDLSLAATWQVAGAMFVAITCAHFIGLCLICNRWSAKPVLAVLIVANAFAVYFVSQYTVYLDPSMLRNVLRSNVTEATELFSFGIVVHLLAYAGLPLFLLSRVSIVARPLLRAVLWRLGMVALALIATVAALLLQFQDISATMRNQKAMRYLITPGNFVYSGIRVLDTEAEIASQALALVGEDATQVTAGEVSRRPRLVVIVVGETARAANWELSGYVQNTTPELAKLDVVNFIETTSCGTNTEVSLPCMFAQIGRRDYDESRIRSSESLLHVLKRAGVTSTWIDNQSGCKGVCANLEYLTAGASFSQDEMARWCPTGQCFDEALVIEAKHKLTQASGDTLLILHQMGNHGPAYFKRYPPAFERFKPACKRVELGKCTQQEIINAYDNALLYTDHVLGQAIAMLQTQTSHDALMLYVSDHGESLGENNLYLHGVPYSIAPRTQTHVPMVLWLSPGFRAAVNLNLECLQARAKLPSSHDDLFHTVLRLFDVHTKVYQPKFDLLAGCVR